MIKDRRLVIIGNSEIAAMAYEYFTHDSRYDVVGFAIDAEFISDEQFCGLPVVPMDEIENRFSKAEHHVFVAIGDSKLNRVRRHYFDRARSIGYGLATYVSSAASVWHNVQIGANCFIFENNVLQPFVEIGDNVILWSGNHIGHRTIVEEDVFIASHVVISGYCVIGRSSFLGVNVAVSNNVTIGADNFIGIGAIITADTPDNTMWRAMPAELRKSPARRALRVDE
jgi:sugar O-acyltransferase (sialic acid O-acetyltransferase NeuD family)